MATSAPVSDYFLREIGVFLVNDTTALDVSNLRVTFSVRAADEESPNNATIRIYNPSQNTLNRALAEFDRVVLEAGYEGTKAIIFKGTIKQYNMGRERNVDTYLEVLAADGDLAYNASFINQTLAPNATRKDVLTAIAKAMNVNIDVKAPSFLDSGVLPRGKVLWGMPRAFMRELARTANCSWSIQNGILTLIPLDGYLSDVVTDINSRSGMIGVPEATDIGVNVEVLLNPLLRVGNLIHINQNEINRSKILDAFGFASYNEQRFVANTTDTGIYKIFVIEHEGDTRGTEWYTRLTCLSINQVSGTTTK